MRRIKPHLTIDRAPRQSDPRAVVVVICAALGFTIITLIYAGVVP